MNPGPSVLIPLPPEQELALILVARTPGLGDTVALVLCAGGCWRGPGPGHGCHDTRGTCIHHAHWGQRGPIPRAEGAPAGPAGTEAPLCEAASRLAKVSQSFLEQSPGTVTSLGQAEAHAVGGWAPGNRRRCFPGP